MVSRKLKLESNELPYIKGYLHEQIEQNNPPDFGYPENHLLDVGNVSHRIESSFEIATRQRNIA